MFEFTLFNFKQPAGQVSATIHDWERLARPQQGLGRLGVTIRR
jgi:hypothetical protein